MPSPFPGMNPYLEHPHVWHDFHNAFAIHLREEVAKAVPSDYVVRVDENVYIHELPEEQRKLFARPDVAIAHGSKRQDPTHSALELLEAPSAIRHYLTVDELHENYLTIRDSKTREVITVIEILSPSNKIKDRDQYVEKRNEILKGPSHLVEIDLLRIGERMPDMNLPPCDYAIMVSHRDSRPDAGFWPISIRSPIPLLPIPLRGEEFVRVDLKPAIDRVYDTARYENDIYTDPITPPLPSTDAEWAADLLKRAGISAAA